MSFCTEKTSMCLVVKISRLYFWFILIPFQFFPQIWVAKLGVQLIRECGLYTSAYGTSEKTPRSRRALSSYKGTQSYFFFAGTFKNIVRKFKISIERANLHLTLILLAVVEIRLLNVFFWERKTAFVIGMKSAGCGILTKKEQECRIKEPPSPFQTLTRHCFGLQKRMCIAD